MEAQRKITIDLARENTHVWAAIAIFGFRMHMKLITHNFMTSKCLKDVKNGFPLLLKVTEKEEKSVAFDSESLQRIMPKIDYNCLLIGAAAVDERESLPSELPENWKDNVELQKQIHRLLFCIEISDGQLECPETGKVFMIKEGIPNMLCSNDEIHGE